MDVRTGAGTLPGGEPAVPAVVGWRIWRLEGERLYSWRIHHMWPVGEQEARCLRPPISWAGHDGGPCEHSPGKGCQCGFWALWTPARCFRKARREQPLTPVGEPVIGLMRGWGEVAVHGTEGFRAERAAILCLFSNSIWDPQSDRVLGQGFRWWRSLSRLLASAEAGGERQATLRGVAARHGVPLVDLAGAVQMGLLAEMGVDLGLIRQLEGRLLASA